ncbi:MAG: SseB protein [Rhodobacteraceae bacterium HLUCCA08]|nr:MAG: SseB protein [Rhodobacteraceae bacterium HLUCCA08]
MSAIDHAHAAMHARPGDDGARLRFYEALAEAELFLLLEDEPTGADVNPRLFEVEEGQFVLVFDDIGRLSDFVGGAAPFASLPGRGLAAMLEGRGIGLALNIGVAPSQMLLPAEAVDWLARTLAGAPSEVEDRIAELLPPEGLAPSLLAALDRRLARAGGLARAAYLAGVRYADGHGGHLLALIGTAPGAEAALSADLSEALTFSGDDSLTLDIVHLAPDAPILPALDKVALRFDLPEPQAPKVPGSNPGMDPDRPPKLR